MRDKRWNEATNAYVYSEQVIGELLDKGTVLIPMAVDPFGRWGPLMRGFLFDEMPRRPMTFRADKPNAKKMYNRILECPCPRGIVTAASITWKHNKSRRFFGHSYTAPTPREHTLQQIGLTVTKAYAMHLRKASKFFTLPSVPSPVGFGLSDSQYTVDDASVT